MKKVFLFVTSLFFPLIVSALGTSDMWGNSSQWRPYAKGGVYATKPDFGVGLQYRTGHHGWDGSLGCYFYPKTVYAPYAKAFYQYYVQKSGNSLYLGAGAGANLFAPETAWAIWPQLQLGYEWLRKDRHSFFIQVEANCFPQKNNRFAVVPETQCGFRF